MMKNKTLVIGASENPQRYSFMAINRLLESQHEVRAIANRFGVVKNVIFEKEHIVFDDIDTVTLYVNSTIQPLYENYILQLKPRRVIFNPGTENVEFENKLEANGIEAIEACTLVMLSTGQY